MKTLLRIAAVLTFLFPFVCGVWLLYAGLSAQTKEDLWIPLVMGSFLVGNAFFLVRYSLWPLKSSAEMMGANDCAT
jgi:hypothetical protein